MKGMVLYLCRHGMAVPAAKGGDAARPLSPEGIDQLQRQARVLALLRMQVNRLYCSPLLRARQTAELLAPSLGVMPETDRLLQPGCTLDDVGELLARDRQAEQVMLVGHQPYLGHFVRVLSGGNARMWPGMLAVLDVQAVRPGGGLLLGLYDPEVLARLGSQM